MTSRAMVAAEVAALGDIQLFDAHAHTGVDIDGSSRTCEEHVEALEAVGGRSVVFPLAVETGYAEENRRVIEESRAHPERLVPFARLDPRTVSTGEITGALEAGARGFKLHPRAESFGLADPGVDSIVAVAAEARVPVLVHAGVGVGSFGEAVTDLASRHRSCPIILAHAAVSDLAWLWRVAPEHPNLFFDTSWWNASDLLALFALIPPGQILFGSDEPYMDLGTVTAITMRCARACGLSTDALGLVAGGQLERLLEGEAPIEAGPAPGPPAAAPSPTESRLSTLIAASGGCMLGGGDPSTLLELARAGVGAEGSALSNGNEHLIAELLEEAIAGTDDSSWALALALAVMATPGVESASAVA